MKKTLLICFILFALLPLWSQHKATLIHADANLYKVDSLLYRSEQLVAEDKAIIKNIPIKSIVNLRYFTRSGDKKIFNASDNIKLINHPLLTWRIKAPEIARTPKTRSCTNPLLSRCRPHRYNGGNVSYHLS